MAEYIDPKTAASFAPTEADFGVQSDEAFAIDLSRFILAKKKDVISPEGELMKDLIVKEIEPLFGHLKIGNYGTKELYSIPLDEELPNPAEREYERLFCVNPSGEEISSWIYEGKTAMGFRTSGNTHSWLLYKTIESFLIAMKEEGIEAIVNLPGPKGADVLLDSFEVIRVFSTPENGPKIERLLSSHFGDDAIIEGNWYPPETPLK